MNGNKIKHLKEIAEKKLMDAILPALHDNYNYFNDEYYLKLNDEQIDFLDSVGGLLYDLVEDLREDPNQYVFLSFLGEPFDFDMMKKKVENGYSDDNQYSVQYNTLKHLEEILNIQEKLYKEHEPLQTSMLYDFVIYACLLDKNKNYNK